MSTPKDQITRDKALDISKSFIVQAPAGSGKTHLLVERYLALIMACDKVEHVTALTFTKKAADEMRQRVQTTLENPHSPWQEKLSKRRLNASQIMPETRITTIDSFCNAIISIVRTPPRIHPQPQIIYERVVDLALNHALTECDMHDLWHWTDGDYHRLKSTLVYLLKSRIHWAYDLLPIDVNEIEKKTLDTIHNLHHWLANELNKATRFTQNIQLLVSDLEQFNLGNLPNTQTFCWHEITSWLLTKQGTMRAKLNKNQGFPAKSTISADLHEQLTQQWSRLCTYVAEHPDYATLLRLFSFASTDPIDPTQVKVLKSIRHVMPKILALLHDDFASNQLADFDEILIQAINLAHNDPTVQEKLFSSIHHMLIDECQDTSPVQFDLIRAITSMWDTRQTLFMVGDPQQSIYQFRNADVRQFLNIQEQGFGDIMIEPLYLTANFRSSSNLVESVNTLFEDIFSKSTIINMSMMPYHKSDSTLAKSEGMTCVWFGDNKREKLQWLCDDIKKTDPMMSICILVRQRQSAKEIIQYLEQNHILYDAPDIFPCQQHSDFSDVLALTHALNDPYDLKEWYAVLTQQMTGMTFADIASIAEQKFTHMSIESMQSMMSLPLSIAKEHIEKWQEALTQSQNNPHWQMGTRLWQTLQYMDWLEIMTDSVIQTVYLWCQKLNDLETIEPNITKQTIDLIAQQNFITHKSPNPRLTIMTVHHAKGLEFDKVYIPLFDPNKLKKETPALYNGHFYIDDEPAHCMLPRLDWHGKDPHHNWLTHIHKIQQEQEENRLMYVALTRAKRSCVMIGSQDLPNHSIAYRVQQHLPIRQPQEKTLPHSQGPYTRRKLSKPTLYMKTQLLEKKAWTLKSISYEQCIGIIIHDFIYRIWRTKSHDIQALFCQHEPFWSLRIQEMGHHTTKMLNEVKRILQTLILHQDFMWIIKPRPEIDHAEWPCQFGHINYIIDRIFLEDNIIHIIDYKYSHSTLSEAHTQQLLRYKEVVQSLYPLYSIKLYIFNIPHSSLNEFKPSPLIEN